MKVAHVPYTFYPDPSGGTEVYVAALCGRLRDRGVEGIVAAPGAKDDAYTEQGIRVRRFAVPQAANLEELYGEGNIPAADAFGRILDEERPDIVHLHAWSRGVSLRTAREAQGRRIPIVVTYHTPAVTCQRGTLLRWGRDICDGAIRTHTCAACALHDHGLGEISSRILGGLPSGLGKGLGWLGLSGGAWTALRMSDLLRRRRNAIRELFELAARVVAPRRWVRELLVLNGVPETKIVVSPQGLTQERSSKRTSNDTGCLRIIFLGRLHPRKGLDILIRAVRSLPGAPFEFHIYGVADAEAYLAELKNLAQTDVRISFLPPVASESVVDVIGRYDIVAVPSQLLETGPLVVLEAFAAGTPVVGTNLGGIQEMVTDGVDGLLVEPGSVSGWSAALKRLVEERGLIEKLRAGIQPPRTMRVVAEEMEHIYRDLPAR